MRAYKGFNKDMTCRGFQYKEGGEYETDEAKVCDCGFHACEYPLECFGYYKPGESVYHEVELDGSTSRQNGGGTKVAATKIKIGARLTIAGLVKAAVDFVISKVKATTGKYAHASTTGKYAHASTTGYAAHAATTGYAAHAATTGYAAHAATTGKYANAATTGDDGKAEVKDGESIAVVTGLNCCARGGVGSWLVLTERDADRHIVGIKAIKINGKKYKPDTWYTLKGGKVVEARDED